jgi:hypothetical protein
MIYTHIPSFIIAYMYIHTRISSLIKIGSGILKLMGGFTDTRRALRLHKPTLIFPNKESRLKIMNNPQSSDEIEAFFRAHVLAHKIIPRLLWNPKHNSSHSQNDLILP